MRSTPCDFQWASASPGSIASTRPTSSSMRFTPSGEERADLLGDHEQVVDDLLGLAVEAPPQLGVLARDPDRAGVQVADPHHDAAGHDQRGGREAVLVGAEERRDQDVAPGPHLAVDLQDHARAQVVREQRLLGLGPISQGTPADWMEDWGEAPVPPSWPAITTWSAPALTTPAATVPTPTSDASFTETLALGFEVRRS